MFCTKPRRSEASAICISVRRQLPRAWRLLWPSMIPWSEPTESTAKPIREDTQSVKLFPKCSAKEMVLPRARADQCIIIKNKPISTVAMESLALRCQLAWAWPSLWNIRIKRMWHQLCSGMVRPIKGSCSKLPTWPSFGTCQLFLSVKIISMVWARLSRDLQWIQISTREEIKFQASVLMEIIFSKLEKWWSSPSNMLWRRAHSSSNLWPIVMQATRCRTQEQPTGLVTRCKIEEKRLIPFIRSSNWVWRISWWLKKS